MTEKPIAEMIAAGEVRKAELTRMAGGLYTLSEVAAILAISEQLIEQRRKAGELIAVRLAESYCYPACQFTPHGIVTGLSEVLAVMPIRHAWMRLEWLLVPDEALEGLSPLEALRAGRLEDVIDIARGHEGQDPRQVLSTEDTSGDITGSVALIAISHHEPTSAPASCGKTEELVHQTDFACHTRMPQPAVAAADHAHHLKTVQGRRGSLHSLEAARRSDHPLERAVTRFDAIVIGHE